MPKDNGSVVDHGQILSDRTLHAGWIQDGWKADIQGLIAR